MTIEQFWYSTIGEIKIYLEVYKQQEEARVEETLTANYNIAYLTASFVGCSLSGKAIPSIQEVFPNMFRNTIDENQRKENENKAWAMYKEQMLDYMIAHNKHRAKRKAEK